MTEEEKSVAEDEIVSITDSVDTNLSKLHEIVEDREAGHSAVHGVASFRFLHYQSFKNRT